ncbi:MULTISPECIES: hypothetical protein [Streptomyces]|uniref:YtxH domain-containing protein n=2 Tax=Streptomyces TaxID=1883 RepID=A0A124ECR7_9ACTN|nr:MULTISPECIES: hypothetical protein [Streptomyces]KUH38496.1 hypothetical protein ATE80_12200 [Streptomyces kanasensis]UUS30937.1 YtxH domain-containing protein [Streptomyces changanensis]
MRYKITFAVGAAVGYVLGTRAGREQYEKLRASARRLSANPAVRNVAESATQTGRQVAGRAYHTVSVRVGDRMPEAVSERVRSLRGRGQGAEDEWGTSNT